MSWEDWDTPQKAAKRTAVERGLRRGFEGISLTDCATAGKCQVCGKIEGCTAEGRCPGHPCNGCSHRDLRGTCLQECQVKA